VWGDDDCVPTLSNPLINRHIFGVFSMKIFGYVKGFALAVAVLSASATAALWAQTPTLSLDDTNIVQANTNRIGINIGAINYWDNGQILKNLIGSINPGFEPLIDRQIWALDRAGTTATSFTIPDQYDGVPPNYWTGGTFTVIGTQSGTGGELGCTGNITSNSGPNYPVNGVTNWVPPVVTVAKACNAPFSAGDIIIISKMIPTPESWWEGSNGGFWGSVAGGGKLLSQTTGLCDTCGSQALNMNAMANGSTATAAWYFDTRPDLDIFVLLNGNYEITFWAKVGDGSPKLNISVTRPSSGGFNCGPYTQSLTSTWTKYTLSCTASESATSTKPENAQVVFTASGGSVYLDNVSFAKVSDPSYSNPTVLRDEVLKTLQRYYANTIPPGPAGMFRYWLGQNGETLDNWIQPDYAHSPTTSGTGYFVQPNGSGVQNLTLEDYLVICQLLGAEPYLEVPVTFSSGDAQNLIEFLASPSSTPYGGKRANLGQTEPWTSVFDKIHLSFCNECWNFGSFAGQSLSYRAGLPNSDYYYDYSMRSKAIFAAMRGDSYYSPTFFDLVMNAQTAVNYTMDDAIQRAHPDSIEIEDYTYPEVDVYSTDDELWGPAMVEPYEKVANSNEPKNFYKSVHDYQSQMGCGASGTALCNVNIYEWGQGTLTGTIDQTHLDYINAGAGEGVVMALQPLLNLQYYGIQPQSYFSLTEFLNGAAGGKTVKLWGNVVDMGGATGNVRPEFLAVSLVNQSIIGPMFSCPINANVTYDFAGSQNGYVRNAPAPMPALKSVPYLYSFCFKNGNKRSVVLINTDLSNPRTLNFGGTNPPGVNVTQRQLAPGSLNDMNEAPTNSASNMTTPKVVPTSPILQNSSSITLPPHSVTALDYEVIIPPPPIVDTPSFSPPGGTYPSAQSVVISSKTLGATIHCTIDGTTPTASSPVCSGPISVTKSERIEAIATASGYTDSPVAVATYTITLPAAATPSFTPPSGTYFSAQSVTISSGTPGATIYYTTNGATPTVSSLVYSGPITVSTSETIKAIAVVGGYANSEVGSASYTIGQSPTQLLAPTFNPPGGTYGSAQIVTISDSTAGTTTTIYYTTDGTAPSTASAVYTNPLPVNTSETIEAIAVASGYSTSPLAAASYTITPAAPPPLPQLLSPIFNPSGGTYSSAQTVTIRDDAGTTIYYTTDGTTPTSSSAVYSSPITISSSVTLNAIAVETGYRNSSVATAAYIIANPAKSFTFSGTIVNVASGNSGTSTLTITPAGGYTGSITFTCTVTSRPSHVPTSDDPTCAQLTATITDGTNPTTATLTVSEPILKGQLKDEQLRSPWYVPGGVVSLAAVVLLVLPSRRRAWKASICIVGLLVAGLSGCGYHPGKGSSYTYVLTITGTDSANNLTATSKIYVEVLR
jgi:Chitobiase/beta-hexosaminidase C-terminal domain